MPRPLTCPPGHLLREGLPAALREAGAESVVLTFRPAGCGYHRLVSYRLEPAKRTLPADQVDRLRQLAGASFRSILPETRAHDGCMGVKTLQNSDAADQVVVVEMWESRGHHEKYLAWQRDRGTSARLMEGLAEPPSIRHFDVTDA